jgi:hypothetical protein
MKPKPNWNEIEERTDFGSVSEKLTQFGASGAGRRKTVNDLLDKVKDALLEARSNGASYRALAAFLNSNGLPVSEPTLRQYLRTRCVTSPPSRRKKARVTVSPLKAPHRANKPAPEPIRPQRSERQSGGPRIANINDL